MTLSAHWSGYFFTRAVCSDSSGQSLQTARWLAAPTAGKCKYLYLAAVTSHRAQSVHFCSVIGRCAVSLFFSSVIVEESRSSPQAEVAHLSPLELGDTCSGAPASSRLL